MGSQGAQDVSWIETRLTVARWHLDAAVSSPDGAAHYHREQAWMICDAIVLALATLKLDPSEHGRLEREVAAVRSRLAGGSAARGSGRDVDADPDGA